jgi:hypothetical protein
LGSIGKQGTDAGEVSGAGAFSWSIFLTVAVFAVGLLFSSSFHPSEPPKIYVLENSESHASASLDFSKRSPTI